MSADPRQRALEFLGEHHVMTLATLGADGLWAAAVFFAHDGFDFYFLSSPKSRHGVSIGEGADIAVSIQRDYDDWPGIRGMQMSGRAQPIVGAELDHAKALYGERFPVIGKAAAAPRAIMEALGKARWYRFRPTTAFLTDNRLGFAHREQLDPAE